MNPWFETTIETRSYEIDAFGHLNHAVYLNYFEVARIQLLEDAGYPVQELLERGWGVHVVRVEVDYEKQVFIREKLRIRTRLDETKRSSMSVVQEMVRDPTGSTRDSGSSDPSGTPDGHGGSPGPVGVDGGEIVCRARVVWVWVSESGRPQRVPEGVRKALEKGPRAGSDRARFGP